MKFKPVGYFRVERLRGGEAPPQFLGGREGLDLAFPSGEVVELDNAVAVGRVGEFEPEDFGVRLGLLQPLARGGVGRLGFDDRDSHVGAIAQDIVGALAGPAMTAATSHEDAAVGERDLFVQGCGSLSQPAAWSFGTT